MAGARAATCRCPGGHDTVSGGVGDIFAPVLTVNAPRNMAKHCRNLEGGQATCDSGELARLRMRPLLFRLWEPATHSKVTGCGYGTSTGEGRPRTRLRPQRIHTQGAAYACACSGCYRTACYHRYVCWRSRRICSVGLRGEVHTDGRPGARGRSFAPGDIEWHDKEAGRART